MLVAELIFRLAGAGPAISFLVTGIYSRQKAIWLADLHGFWDRSKTGKGLISLSYEAPLARCAIRPVGENFQGGVVHGFCFGNFCGFREGVF